MSIRRGSSDRELRHVTSPLIQRVPLRRTLQFRLFLALWLPMLGLVVVLHVQLRNRLRQEISLQHGVHLETVLSLACQAVERDLARHGDLEAAGALLSDLELVPGFGRAELRDLEGRLRYRRDARRRQPGTSVALTRPLFGAAGPVGTLNLSVSSRPMGERAPRFSWASLPYLVVFVLTTLLATIFLTRRALHPLQELKSALQAVSSGDFQRRIGLRSLDEVGVLAIYFDRLVDHLQATRTRLGSMAEELEERVESRTRELWTEVINRMDVEARLRASEERFRSIFDLATDVIFIKDPDGRYLLINPAGCAVMGRPGEEIIGKTDLDLFPQFGESIQRHDRETLETAAPITYEATREFPAGERRFQTTKIPFQTESGQGVLGLSRDVTDAHKSRKLLENAVREKEALLKEVHHRVKNNLQIVVSLLNLQSRSTDEEETASVLRESRDRVRSMSLIHEMLYRNDDFSSVDLAAYLSSLSRELFRSFGTRRDHVQLVLDIMPIRLSMGEAVPVALILNELLSNALKHAFPGERSGRVRVEVTVEVCGEVRLVVEDDGVGCAEQAGTSRSVGKALIRDLTKQLRGALEFESGPGTRYCIRFPSLGTLGNGAH